MVAIWLLVHAYVFAYTSSLWPGPRLMTDTQHSTLKTQCIRMGESWVWSVNPECRVLSIHHKFWAQALNLWRFLSILHLKLQHQIHIFEWGILKCGRIHILCSGILNQIHGVLSVECWVSVISLGPGFLLGRDWVIRHKVIPSSIHFIDYSRFFTPIFQQLYFYTIKHS